MAKVLVVDEEVHARLKHASIDLKTDMQYLTKEALDDWFRKRGIRSPEPLRELAPVE